MILPVFFFKNVCRILGGGTLKDQKKEKLDNLTIKSSKTTELRKMIPFNFFLPCSLFMTSNDTSSDICDSLHGILPF